MNRGDLILGPAQPAATRRLDQWLWFARFAKSRSIASRLCAEEAVTINGFTVRKANRSVRVGDTVAIRHGGFSRTVRVLDLGIRRGPTPEARTLYEETAAAAPLADLAPAWIPLLGDD